jgi:hypothetical protein
MKTIRNLTLALFAVATLAFSQAVTTSTTLAQAQGARDTIVTLTSSTNVLARGVDNVVQTGIYVDREYEIILSNANAAGTGNVWNVLRGGGTGAQGTLQAPHLSGATVWLGSPAIFDLGPNDRTGSCANASFVSLPLIEVRSGTLMNCDANSKYSPLGVSAFFVPATSCVGVPTTLTQTTTYPTLGASNVPVMKTISNAAAGTDTITCTFLVPTNVAALRGALLQDVTLFLGSSATSSGVVPTSVGTATLSTITLPTAATTETASTVTPVAIGGTVTTLGAASTAFLSAVTTDGSWYTIKNTFSTAVDLSADVRFLVFTFPVLQSAASVTNLSTPGLLVHYRAPLLY